MAGTLTLFNEKCLQLGQFSNLMIERIKSAHVFLFSPFFLFDNWLVFSWPFHFLQFLLNTKEQEGGANALKLLNHTKKCGCACIWWLIWKFVERFYDEFFTSVSVWTVQSKMKQLEAAKYFAMYRTKDKTTAAQTVQKEERGKKVRRTKNQFTNSTLMCSILQSCHIHKSHLRPTNKHAEGH